MPFPHIDPILVQIGPIAIRWYALAYIATILLGWRYAVAMLRNPKLWAYRPPPCTPEQIDDLVLWATLGVIVGGRLGHVLFYTPELIWTDPVEILKTWHGGMSFHGGALGVVVAGYAFARKYKIDPLRLGDLIVAVEPIGGFLVRIANFINGELWGRPTTVPWGMVFPDAGPLPRHPSQLYEAALEGLVLLAVLRFATHGKKLLNRRGVVIGWFLTGYGLIRISLENVREPDSYMPHFPLGLTMGMMLSTPMVLIGLYLIWRGMREPLPPAIALEEAHLAPPAWGPMSLRERLSTAIAAGGPISVAQYMTACLHDPDFGYYATRPALGGDGDFITAPLISQMFGELVGVWAASAWALLGEPEEVRLVEMGPGDGTLMSDILRAGRAMPGFVEAADVWLVETSGPLKALQAELLDDDVRWAEALADVPGGAPLILIANELLDCLPARQFVRTATGWAEQVVGLDKLGRLTFGLASTPVGSLLPDARVGEVYEQSRAQAALGAELGERVVRDGGAALLIDYGRDAPGFGDTLQALRRHEKVDPLEGPGEADLTIHADFPAVMDAARKQGAETAILTQGEFLARMGIGPRAEALLRARPERSARIGRELTRLIADDEMGELFKACVIHEPDWTPPAFEDPAEDCE